jgi:hypothetical protein
MQTWASRDSAEINRLVGLVTDATPPVGVEFDADVLFGPPHDPTPAIRKAPWRQHDHDLVGNIVRTINCKFCSSVGDVRNSAIAWRRSGVSYDFGRNIDGYTNGPPFIWNHLN